MRGKYAAAAQGRQRQATDEEIVRLRAEVATLEQALRDTRHAHDEHVAALHRQMAGERTRKLQDAHVAALAHERALAEVERTRADIVAETRVETTKALLDLLSRHGLVANMPGWVAFLRAAQVRERDAPRVFGSRERINRRGSITAMLDDVSPEVLRAGPQFAMPPRGRAARRTRGDGGDRVAEFMAPQRAVGNLS